MNTPNPLVPQGTTPAGGKSTVRNAVLTIVVVHVAFIGSLLFWGCSKDSAKPKDDASVTTISNTDNPVYPVNTNDAGTAATPTAPGGAPLVPNGSIAAMPLASSNAGVGAITPLNTNVAVTPAPITPVNPTPVSALTPATPPATTPESEYVVVKGDTLAVIAKNKHVSVKALEAANPNLDPKKLRPGQKLQIPAAVVATSTATPGVGSSTGTTGTEAAASDAQVYTVKAGDSLARIAKNHHTSIKAIVALNGLKSQNSLKVGQKLKMPVAKAAAAAAPAVEAAPSASAAGASPAVTPLSSAPHATTVN